MKDCFFTQNYKDGYIHTCHNRATGKEEISYQIEDTIGSTNTVIGAKRIITRYLSTHPLLWDHISPYTTVRTAVPRSRALNYEEHTLFEFLMGSFAHVIYFPRYKTEFTVFPDHFADRIAECYDSTHPKVQACIRLLRSIGN